MFERLDAFATRLEALDRQLMDPAIASDGRRLREVAQEAAHVREIVEAHDAYKKLQLDLQGAREVLAEESDPELREMARQEITDLEQRSEEAARALKLL